MLDTGDLVRISMISVNGIFISIGFIEHFNLVFVSIRNRIKNSKCRNRNVIIGKLFLNIPQGFIFRREIAEKSILIL